MVAKLRRKIPLDNQDVNLQPSRRKMSLKNYDILNDFNKENIPLDNCSPDSTSSGLTGLINNHLEKQTPILKRVASRTVQEETVPLTKESLYELQDTLKDLEKKFTVQQTSCFIRDAQYFDNDLGRCRNNFLFELECLPDITWSHVGNLRTASYMPSVYEKLDPEWYFNQKFSREDFHDLSPNLKPFYVLNPLEDKTEEHDRIEKPENASVQIEDIAAKTKIPGSKLSFRATSAVFDQKVDCESLFQYRLSDDEISLPDSLDHCKSVKKRVPKRRSLNKNLIMFHGIE